MLGKEFSIKEKKCRKSKRNKLMRFIICSNISFLLSITVTILAFLLIVRFSCFSNYSLFLNMRANNYYSSLQEDMYKKAQSITLSAGLPVEIIDHTMDIYQINRDVQGYINAGIKGKSFAIDTSGIENKLEINIRNYFMEKDFVPTIEQNQTMELYKDSISKLYIDYIKLPLLNSYIKGREIYIPIFQMGLGISIFLITLMLFLIIKLNPWLHRAFRYITYSITASALMIAIIPAILLYYEEYIRINLKPLYVYQMVIYFISNVLETFIKFAVVLGIVAVVLLIIIKELKLRLVIK